MNTSPDQDVKPAEFESPGSITRSRMYKVVGPNGVKVREAEAVDSPLVGELPIDTVVTLAAFSGRRVQLSAPLRGWASLYGPNKEEILRPVHPGAKGAPTGVVAPPAPKPAQK